MTTGATMSYIERERQRSEALRQEELDWLHQQHETLVEQNQLLSEQNSMVAQIVTHTRLLYVVMILWLIGGVVWLMVPLLS